jgi:Holliday junction resolvase RusA-like endonuclease
MDFVVPIKCVAKQRPRYSQYTKTFFTPKKTKEFEADIAEYAAFHMQKHKFSKLSGPVRVDLKIYLKVPASWSKKKKIEALEGNIYPKGSGDLDNYIKSICDGLNGVTWDDDSQVVSITAQKGYFKENLIQISVTPAFVATPRKQAP